MEKMINKDDGQEKIITEQIVQIKEEENYEEMSLMSVENESGEKSPDKIRDNESQNADLMAKQRFLIKEIVNKGYDQEAFSIFLQKDKPEIDTGLDINSWKLDELASVVLNFQEGILQNQKEQLLKSNPLGLTQQSFSSDWEDQEELDEGAQFGKKLLGLQRNQLSQNDSFNQLQPDQQILESVIKESYLERQNKLKSNINAILMKPELMLSKKISPNTFKEVEIDTKTEENILSQNSLVIKCKILKSEIHQQTNFLVLKSQLLVFKIGLKIENTSLNSEVLRLESDFYHLRSIL